MTSFRLNRLWTIVGLVCLYEFLLFVYYLQMNVAPFYAPGFDQGCYLVDSYQLFENIKKMGLWAGIQSRLLPTGFLFPIQASLSYALFGASRFSALLPNFLYFIGLQVFGVWILRSLTQKNYFPFIFLGLVLALKTPFLEAGGLMDFRMDFIAFCLFGIFTFATLQSRIFLDRKWSLLTGGILCFLILMRGLTLAYFGCILSTLLLYFFYSLKKQAKSSLAYQDARARVINLFIVGVMAFFVVLWYLWVTKAGVFHYYFTSHVAGSEKYIRLAEVGIKNFYAELIFYPYAVLIKHFNTLALVLMSLVLCASGLPRKNKKLSSQERRLWKERFFFLGLTVFIPLFVLSLDKSKSYVVCSIVGIPFICLIVYYGLYAHSKREGDNSRDYFLSVFAAAILCVGLFNQFHELHHFPSKARIANNKAIVQMYQDIGDYALQKHWTTVELSVDQVADYLIPQGLAIIYYERQHKLLDIGLTAKLGSTIFVISQAEALASLQQSKVVIFNLNTYPGGSAYPFNQTIETYKPALLAEAERHFKHLGDYHFLDSTFRVYVAE